MESLIYSVIIGGLIGFTIRYVFAYKGRTSFEQEGEYVVIRATPYARLINDQKIKVKNIDIVKLQLAGPCISLFTASNNAIDIWVNKRTIDSVLESAIKYFPSAKLVRLDNELSS